MAITIKGAIVALVLALLIAASAPLAWTPTGGSRRAPVEAPQEAGKGTRPSRSVAVAKAIAMWFLIAAAVYSALALLLGFIFARRANPADEYRSPRRLGKP